MADKSISELVSAEQVKSADLFVLQQDGAAKKLTGQVFLSWLTQAADGHGGIQSIEKTKTSSLIDTYTITLADQTTQEFTVTNGAKGDKGDSTYLWIKYASQEPTSASHSMGDFPDDWIGIYSGNLETAPTDYTQYQWFQIKGEKGNTGDPATLEGFKVEYQVSTSGTVIPSGSWSTSVPVVAQGKYLWTRATITFNTGSPVVVYSVSRMGIDGSGVVSSVAGISPNLDGDVPLTAYDVGALPSSGGTMTGHLHIGTSGYPTVYFEDGDGNSCGSVFASAANKRTYLRCYATDDSGFYENYRAPAANDGMTANKTYDILTTKTVTYGTKAPESAVGAAGIAGRIYFKKVT